MEQGLGLHLEETELEQYSMGTLPESRINSFEEHFLVCETCQDQLLEMEAYVNAVRSVSPKLRQARPRWSFVPARMFSPPVLVVAATIVAALLVSRFWIPAWPSGSEVAVVLLQASRGVDGLTTATATAGHPLALRIDLRELASSPSYKLQIVDSVGTTVEEIRVTPGEGAITQKLDNGLRPGRYYVRLYAASGELLREYGLQIR